MTLEQALALVGVLFLIVVGLIGYVWMDAKRSYERRLDRFEAALEDLSRDFAGSSPAMIQHRVKRLESDYHLLHEWKRVMFPRELENACHRMETDIERLDKDMRERFARIERALNGRIKD